MHDALIYDWNLEARPPRPALVLLNDETLRDGLQSVSYTHLTLPTNREV